MSDARVPEQEAVVLAWATCSTWLCSLLSDVSLSKVVKLLCGRRTARMMRHSPELPYARADVHVHEFTA